MVPQTPTFSELVSRPAPGDDSESRVHTYPPGLHITPCLWRAYPCIEIPILLSSPPEEGRLCSPSEDLPSRGPIGVLGRGGAAPLRLPHLKAARESECPRLPALLFVFVGATYARLLKDDRMRRLLLTAAGSPLTMRSGSSLVSAGGADGPPPPGDFGFEQDDSPTTALRIAAIFIILVAGGLGASYALPPRTPGPLFISRQITGYLPSPPPSPITLPPPLAFSSGVFPPAVYRADEELLQGRFFSLLKAFAAGLILCLGRREHRGRLPLCSCPRQCQCPRSNAWYIAASKIYSTNSGESGSGSFPLRPPSPPPFHRLCPTLVVHTW